MPPLTRYTDLHLDFSEKDFDWKYSKKTIPVYLPEAELVIRLGFQHCGYMTAHPKEYAEEIEAFMLNQVYRPFTGTLKKLMLVSDGVGYGPVPDENDEVQQRLTINSARDAWLTRYAFGDGEKYRRIKREKLKLDADHLEDLFRAVTAVFGSDTEDRFATDVGTWELELTNTDEETFQYVGSMCGDVLYGGRELSDILRDALDAPDLLAFGGGKDEDTVIRIELDYQLGARHELLIADYDDGEILYVIEDDDLHRSMEKRIHDPEEVRQALMGLDTSLFRDPVPAQDAEEPVSERPIYRLQVKTYGGKSLVSEGGSILV